MTRQRAFTLVEILVVILISAILASVTLLSMRDTSGDFFLRDDLDRLAALLKRNCQDALLSGQHLGIQVGDEGYDVFRHDGNNWVNIKSDSVIYRHWDWSGDWELDLEFQGRDAQINGGEDSPQLICLASGELLPFSLVLSEGISQSLVLSGRTNGHVEIETRR
jgi:general secretion pathway protein H